MKSILKNYLVNILVIVAFTFFALWFALKDHASEVWQVIQQANVGMLVLVIGIVVLCQLMVGWILQQYAKIVKSDYSLKEGFVNALVASFFHGITPSASGGQFAQAFVFHKQGIPVEQSASILVIDFIVYQLTLVVVSFILLVLKIPYFMNHSIFILAVLGFGLNLTVIAVLILCTFSEKVYTWLTHFVIKVMARLHMLKDEQKVLTDMQVKLAQFSQGMHVLRNNRWLLCKTVLANALRLLLFFAIPIVCCWALHIEVLPENYVTMIALTSFVMNVNAFIPIPGSSGGTESVFVIMYGMLISSVQASSVMVLWRFATYHFVMIVGALVFIKVQNSKTKVVEKGD